MWVKICRIQVFVMFWHPCIGNHLSHFQMFIRRPRNLSEADICFAISDYLSDLRIINLSQQSSCIYFKKILLLLFGEDGISKSILLLCLSLCLKICCPTLPQFVFSLFCLKSEIGYLMFSLLLTAWEF